MDRHSTGVIHSSNASSLVDVLERILDKGVVIAGDIKLKIVDIELLTIQVRLMICSVDKAREIGMNWWMTNAYIGNAASLPSTQEQARRIDELGARVQELEGALSQQRSLPQGQS